MYACVKELCIVQTIKVMGLYVISSMMHTAFGNEKSMCEGIVNNTLPSVKIRRGCSVMFGIKNWSQRIETNTHSTG